MLASRNKLLYGAVIENLMNAHKRLSHNGSAVQLVILTWYLLRLIKKQKDELVDFVPHQD